MVGAGLGLVAAGVAAGSVLGSALERRVLRRPLAEAAEHGLGFGTVHSAPLVVAADDGVQLYVEVDEPPAGTARPVRPSSSATATRSTWTAGTTSG